MVKKISSTRVVTVSFLVDLSDIVINLIAAILSGSVVMITQALEGTVDLITSGFLLIGVRRSKRRPNKQHRYGYGRELFFWVLMATVSMFFLAGGLSFYLGLERFLNPHLIKHLPYALVTLVIGLVTNSYALMLSLRRLGAISQDLRAGIANIQLSSHIESKSTLVLDLMGTVASLLGIVSLLIYAYTGNPRLDGLGAMLVGIFGCGMAVVLMLEVKGYIIGRAVNPETEEAIIAATKSVRGVLDVLDLKTIHLGTEKVLVNLDVHFKRNLTAPEIDKLISQIKTQIKRTVPKAHYIQIEVELPQ